MKPANNAWVTYTNSDDYFKGTKVVYLTWVYVTSWVILGLDDPSFL